MRVVLVEDDRLFRREVVAMLGELGGVDRVDEAGDYEAALEAVAAEPAPGLVVIDVYLPRRTGERPEPLGAELARRVRDVAPEARVMVLTSLDRESAARLVRADAADDFLAKDAHAAEIEARLATQLRAARREAADLSRRGLRPGQEGIRDLVGDSPAMQQVRAFLRKAAATAAPVLLTGESGTGKEMAAYSLHRLSPWSRGPFVPFHAAAVGEGLLEAELFGHKRGAFTGAAGDRPGVVESAEGGTLFLDEIGELPPPFQVKLLRFLDSGTFHRLGEDRPRTARVRLVFATLRDLDALVASGGFRQDLYYRLDVLHLRMPALRDRSEDLGALAGELAARLAETLGAPAPSLGPEVLARLAEHSWPGNVRELRNVLERAMILSPGGRLDRDALDLAIGPGLRAGPPGIPGGMTPRPAPAGPGTTSSPSLSPPAIGIYRPGVTWASAMEEAERSFLVEALAAHSGNVSATARALEISRRTLQEKMVKLGLRDPG